MNPTNLRYAHSYREWTAWDLKDRPVTAAVLADSSDTALQRLSNRFINRNPQANR